MNTHRRGKIYFIFCSRQAGKDRRSRLACWLIRLFSRSHIEHVAVSNGRAVLCVKMDGKKYYPHDPFMSCYPGIEHVVEIPVKGELDMDSYGSTKPISIARSLFKFMTRGLVPAQDCVESAKDILRDAGFEAPVWVTTPSGLHQHLLSIKDRHERDPSTVARSHRHARRNTQAKDHQRQPAHDRAEPA